MTGATPRDALIDAKSAMRWIRQHAQSLRINTNKIVAAGGSVGGQLAVSTAVNNDINSPKDNLSISSKPNALLLFNPVIDNGPGGFGYSRIHGYWKSFSPMENVHYPMPPTLILIGNHDHLIPLTTIKKFTEKIRKTGARCDLNIFKGAKHGFFNKKHFIEETTEITYRFLKSLGFIK